MEGITPQQPENLRPNEAGSQELVRDLDAPLGKEQVSNVDAPERKNEWSDDLALPEDDLNTPLNEGVENDKVGLSDEQKAEIKGQTGWSDKIVDSIRTVEEAEVYMNSNLQEVNGNLERTDIDWDAKIPQDRIDRMRSLYGDEVADRWANKTNFDLIKEGKAPYGPDGEYVNLHHIGQKADSPLAELTYSEHKQYDGVLHDKTNPSEIDRSGFSAERKQYWMDRYESLQNK